MPTVTLDKRELERLLGKKIPMGQLKDRISMLGTDLEKIEGDEIVVEIFPNRPDMLSEQGFARALSAFLGLKTGLREYRVRPSGHQVLVDGSVSMRPYTACAIVRKLVFTDERIREIMQIQEKLATTHGRNRRKSAYGIYPLKGINFPIRYTARDPAGIWFKPLGFSKAICAAEVPEVHPKGQAYRHLTAGWKKYPFFIDARENVLCMLPFTNSEDTGKVDTSTTEVFIECTGTDFENVSLALNILATSLAEMGGEIYSLEVAYPKETRTTPSLAARSMELDIGYLNRRLGLSLSEKEVTKLLAHMGFGYEKGNKKGDKTTENAKSRGKNPDGKGQVLIPAYRADILHQADIVEDIAIAYGYENFSPEIPQVATIAEEQGKEKFQRILREILLGFGLLEVRNYHLMAEAELNALMLRKERLVSLHNAPGEYNRLRNSVLPSLLKNLRDNQHHEYPQNIFEIGRAFGVAAKTAKETGTGVSESDKLGIAICHENADYTEVRQVVDALLALCGVNVAVRETSHPSFIPGRVAEVILIGKSSGDSEGEFLGFLGEIRPEVLSNWNLAMPVAVAELDIERLPGFSFG